MDVDDIAERIIVAGTLEKEFEYPEAPGVPILNLYIRYRTGKMQLGFQETAKEMGSFRKVVNSAANKVMREFKGPLTGASLQVVADNGKVVLDSWSSIDLSKFADLFDDLGEEEVWEFIEKMGFDNLRR